MSGGTPTPVLGLNKFLDSDPMLSTEVNANSDMTDLLPPTVCTSSTRPSTNLFQGRFIYETDTKMLWQWDKTGTPGWRFITNVGDPMPKPIRGYFINSVKSVTATTWADVGNDNGKFIVCTKPTMIDIHLRVDITGNAATPLSVRLAWYNAIVGDSYNQFDSAILGALTATSAGERQTFGTSLLVPAGTTQFKLQAQRSNTTNATSVNAAAIVITPIAIGAAYAAGAD